MNPLILSALISAVLASSSAWKIQSWRYAAKEKARVEQVLVEQRELRVLENRRYSAAAAAQDAAVGRAVDLRRAADGSRAALISLHDAAATALREADASHAACTVRAATLSGLLADSTKEYRDLGEKASRHVSDIQTMIDAWPGE